MEGLATRPEAIRHAHTPNDIALSRALFVEYARWLRVDLCVQGFEEEVATLPGAYAPPKGCLLLAGSSGTAFGCIALRPLAAASGHGGDPVLRTDTAIAELKRLYVQEAHRGEGWGRLLARAVLGEARAIGYRELRLDTLVWMTAARALYADLGFRECAAYYDSHLADTVCMALTL